MENYTHSQINNQDINSVKDGSEKSSRELSKTQGKQLRLRGS